MSGFVSTVATGFPTLRADDRANCDDRLHFDAPYPIISSRVSSQNEPGERSFASAWWPSGSALIGTGDTAENPLCEADWWSEPWTTSGCNGRLGFVGYTRDVNGSVLGGCTVKCFRTSSDELVSSVQSDVNGFYIATTPYNDGHYLVVQKASATPPVAGASINTVTPA